MEQPKADYKRILKLHQLSDFRFVQIEKQNKWQKESFLLYAKSLKNKAKKIKSGSRDPSRASSNVEKSGSPYASFRENEKY